MYIWQRPVNRGAIYGDPGRKLHYILGKRLPPDPQLVSVAGPQNPLHTGELPPATSGGRQAGLGSRRNRPRVRE